MQQVNTRFVDQFIRTLEKTKPVVSRNRKPKTKYLPEQTRDKIHKLLSCTFKQAVKWEIIQKNPFEFCMHTRPKYNKREIWTAEMIRKALDECEDGKLYIAINLSFACSMREGEILGLTWDNVHISDENIAEDNAYVYIDKELQRASKRALENLEQKDVYHIFQPLLPNTSTRVILKKPKTESSIRRICLPKTLAYILREWKNHQDELKALLGDEYQDFNYAHILDEDRKINATKFDSMFYKMKTDLRNVQALQEEPVTLDMQGLLSQLKNSPELLQQLAQLVNSQSKNQTA